MEEKPKKRLGEILIENGLIDHEALSEALSYQKENGGLIGQIFIHLGYLTEEQLVSALGSQLKIPYIPLNQYAVNMETVRMVDEVLCRRNVLVVFDADETRLFVAMSDPLNTVSMEELRQKTKLKPQIFISTTTEIVNLLDLAFQTGRAPGPKQKTG